MIMVTSGGSKIEQTEEARQPQGGAPTYYLEFILPKTA